jgi:hypothetical protein
MNNELLLLLLCPAGVPHRRPTSELWLTRYDGLVAWMTAHDGAWPREKGRLGPMSNMSDGDAEEHRHAVWVHDQRKRGRATLLKEVVKQEGVRRAELLERLEGWTWHEYESWISRYNGLVAWIRAHGGVWPREKRRPGRMSTLSAEDAEEHRHAVWVGTQRGRGQPYLSKKIEEPEGVSRAVLCMASATGSSGSNLTHERWGCRGTSACGVGT